MVTCNQGRNDTLLPPLRTHRVAAMRGNDLTVTNPYLMATTSQTTYLPVLLPLAETGALNQGLCITVLLKIASYTVQCIIWEVCMWRGGVIALWNCKFKWFGTCHALDITVTTNLHHIFWDSIDGQLILLVFLLYFQIVWQAWEPSSGTRTLKWTGIVNGKIF